MERSLLQKLIEWKDKKDRKPLLLKGARQVGKTWLLKQFAEVDFVISVKSHIVPVEVKAEENLKAKSLRRYREKYGPPISVRTSLSGYHKDDGLVNIPLYALFNLGAYVDGWDAKE